jgi:hypothetical protein
MECDELPPPNGIVMRRAGSVRKSRRSHTRRMENPVKSATTLTEAAQPRFFHEQTNIPGHYFHPAALLGQTRLRHSAAV